MSPSLISPYSVPSFRFIASNYLLIIIQCMCTVHYVFIFLKYFFLIIQLKFINCKAECLFTNYIFKCFPHFSSLYIFNLKLYEILHFNRYINLNSYHFQHLWNYFIRFAAISVSLFLCIFDIDTFFSADQLLFFISINVPLKAQWQYTISYLFSYS